MRLIDFLSDEERQQLRIRYDDASFPDYVNELLNKEVDTAEHERWIPCEERMPEEPFGCLVTVMDTEPMTCADFENILPYFVGWDGERWNDGDGEQCPFEVLAWMRLPEPYMMDEEAQDESND